MDKIKHYLVPALVALVVSVVACVYFVGGANQSNLGSVRQTADTFVNGIGFSGGTVDIVGGVIGTGKNQASWKNTTGKDVYVGVRLLKPIATSTDSGTNGPIASSTMQVVVGTSTSATIGDYTAPSALTSSSLVFWKIATSTVARTLNASSTSSYSTFGGNTTTNGRVRVAPNEYVNIAILAQANDADSIGAPSPLCVGGTDPVCESATSTARGFNLRYFLDITSRP